jgi:hypothetical protein
MFLLCPSSLFLFSSEVEKLDAVGILTARSAAFLDFSCLRVVTGFTGSYNCTLLRDLNGIILYIVSCIGYQW